MPRFTYSFPLHDGDQQSVKSFGVLEPHVSYHFAKDIRTCCESGGHVLDIGGNFGWYALLSAASGCRADTFEPVPWFYAAIEYSKSLNIPKVKDKVHIHKGKIVGSVAGQRRQLMVPKTGVLGTACVDCHLKKTRSCGDGIVCLNVTTTTVDEFHTDFLKMGLKSCAMKVDVEGFEPEVFKGGSAFLQEQRPRIIVIELSPGMTKHWDPSGMAVVHMVDSIVSAGYRPHFLVWKIIKSKNKTVATSSMDRHLFQGSAQSLVTQCGFNCMVYFRHSS